MKIHVLHELKGRIRFSTDLGKLTAEQADQLQYYLHHGHDTEDNGNSGLWSAGVLWGTGDSHVPVYQTLYEKVVEKNSGKIWLSG